MRPTTTTTTITIALTLAACASTATRAGTEPLRYPALPAAPSGTTQVAAFDPAPGLTTLTLACRGEELALANAIDDDCNGQIDDGPAAEAPAPAAPERTADALLIAIAYPRAAAVSLALRTPQQQLELAAPACDESQAFCTLQLATDRLVRGRHALVVHPLVARTPEGVPRPTASADGAATPPPSVVVSVQSRGKVTTYLAPLGDRTVEQSLGELALP